MDCDVAKEKCVAYFSRETLRILGRIVTNNHECLLQLLENVEKAAENFTV